MRKEEMADNTKMMKKRKILNPISAGERVSLKCDLSKAVTETAMRWDARAFKILMIMSTIFLMITTMVMIRILIVDSVMNLTTDPTTDPTTVPITDPVTDPIMDHTMDLIMAPVMGPVTITA